MFIPYLMRILPTLIACACLLVLTSNASADDQYVLEQISDRGVYRATLKPESATVPIGKLHNWILHIETIEGDSFFPNQLDFQGGMPGHGHGFPAEPKISRYLEEGNFLVEGMLFNMAGPWQLRVGIGGPSGWDTVTLPVKVTPPSNNLVESEEWTQSELSTLRTLSWSSAEPIIKDPSNRFVGNIDAIRLGEELFFDQKLSASGNVSCATCHHPDKSFSDGLSLSFGTAQTKRHSPSLIGIARNRWFYWDGRRDSLWAQAVTPIETVGEMDNNRMDVVRYVVSNERYKDTYQSLVGSLPNLSDEQRFPIGASPYAKGDGKSNWSQMKSVDRDTVNTAFANIGKFIAAYESTLDYQTTRFDDFVNALLSNNDDAHELITEQERAGIKLFLDNEKTQCLRCHNGPLLSNRGFHNIGTAVANGKVTDFGRIFGMQAVDFDIFNCAGNYSDAEQDDCTALRFALKREVPSFFEGAFKVPSLRNVENTSPYLHDGRYETLVEVIKHYRLPPVVNGELQALDLSDEEVDQLVAFLKMLSS